MIRFAMLPVVLVAVSTLFNCGLSHSAELTLEVPKPGVFIRDLSDLLDQEAEAKIRSICKSLHKEQETQIIVITIDSVVKYGGKNSNITRFAARFISKLNLARNQGGDKTKKGRIILFMIAKDEKKAHIVFGGPGWEVEHEKLRRHILEELVNPQIQQAHYAAGIVQGVEELDKLSRGQSFLFGGQWLWMLIAFAVGAILLVTLVVLRARPAQAHSAPSEAPLITLDDDFYLNRGIAKDKLDLFDEAITDYTEAIRLNPKLTLAYVNRGRTWIKKVEFDTAIADFNEAIRLSPEDAEAYYYRGLAWKTKGDMAKAEADFNKVEMIYTKQIDG